MVLLWNADQWIWEGTNWSQLSVQGDLFDGWSANPVQFAYDPGRQRLRAFGPTEGLDQPRATMWDLRQPSLTVNELDPPLGQSLQFFIDLPGQGGNLFVLAYSGSNRPGIPLIPQPYSRPVLLPLAPDALFSASLGAGVFVLLDLQGRGGRVLPPLPLNPTLIGLSWYAAGASLDVQALRVGAVTNELQLRIPQ